MPVRALFFCFIWINSTICYGQGRPIRGLRAGDTLQVKLDYIACRIGLGTRIRFSLVHDTDAYKIQYDDDSAWFRLTKAQEEGLRRFERACVKSECRSTSYVNVDLMRRSETSSYEACWSVADELVEVLKRR